MDREALLQSLGLTSDELKDFLRKFANFQRELNTAQLRVLVRSLPSIEQARKSLGPTTEDLTELFGSELGGPGNVVLCIFEGDGGDVIKRK